MIKFFRKRRQKTLAENKFGKYLTYAVGEIILVVIGILIAIQINNRNEVDKIKELEIASIEEIKTSLESDLVSINRNLTVLEARYNALIFIDSQFNLEKTNVDTLSTSFGLSNIRSVFSPDIAAYESLKSEGITLISNKTLRNRITSIYEESYPLEPKEIKFLSDEFVQQYNIRHFNKVSYVENSKVGRAKPARLIPHDIDLLKNDSIYRAIVRTKIDEADYLINFIYKGTRDNTILPTIDLLEKEIDKLKRE